MEKSKLIIIRLFIVFISFFCIDGGRSVLHFSSDLQIIFTQENANDFELPHQHHLVNFNDDAKWLASYKFDFSCFNYNPVKFLYTPDISSQEFLISIWQPPKFV
jgi:hypothetical protein